MDWILLSGEFERYVDLLNARKGPNALDAWYCLQLSSFKSAIYGGSNISATGSAHLKKLDNDVLFHLRQRKAAIKYYGHPLSVCNVSANG